MQLQMSVRPTQLLLHRDSTCLSLTSLFLFLPTPLCSTISILGKSAAVLVLSHMAVRILFYTALVILLHMVLLISFPQFSFHMIIKRDKLID